MLKNKRGSFSNLFFFQFFFEIMDFLTDRLIAKHTALRVVLNMREIEELTALREETNNLREELKLWKNGKELPKIGKYYFADDNLLETHGWTFQEGIALRYEGTVERNVTNVYGNTCKYIEHIFTAPYEYDNEDDFDRTGWIKIGFETHELHQTREVDWDDFAPNDVLYLDSNDKQAYGPPFFTD